MSHKDTLPSLSSTFMGVSDGPTIVSGVIDIASALAMTNPSYVGARQLMEIERLLSPLQAMLALPSFTALPPVERLAAVLEKISNTKLSANAPVSSIGSGTDGTDTSSSTSSGKLLVAQLTTPAALFQLDRLRTYRSSADFDPTTYLELAMSGRMTPEMRAEANAAAAAIQDPAARRSALAAIAEDDERRPLSPLLQLAWGHVKALEGYPECQDVYDIGLNNMPSLFARACARAFSPDGNSVPLPLKFAKCDKLAATFRSKAWDTIDFCSDGDAVMLAYIEGGDGSEVERVPATQLYADISQVRRVLRIATNCLALLGIANGPTRSFRQAVAICEHAHMIVPASDVSKRARLGKAMQRLIQRALSECGKRIDLVRYSTKADATGPRHLFPEGKGGALEEFSEVLARVLDDQKRRRADAGEAATPIKKVRLPEECPGAPSLQRTRTDERTTHTPSPPVVKFDLDKMKQQPSAVTKGDAPKPAQPAGVKGFSPLKLVTKPGQGEPEFTIHVNKAGALKWLAEHGNAKPCLGFLFGHASQRARRGQSCGQQQASGHTQEAKGPHLIPTGWVEAAPSFVLQADRASF